MIFYEPRSRDQSVLPHDPFKSLVAPRPIGWISTKSAGGQINRAPHSLFNAVAEAPPMLAFSSRVAWCGGPDDYTVVERIFEMLRPRS